MSVFHKIRLYHAALAILVTAAYLTGDELEGLHNWLGYAVAAIILFRVLWRRPVRGSSAFRGSSPI